MSDFWADFGDRHARRHIVWEESLSLDLWTTFGVHLGHTCVSARTPYNVVHAPTHALVCVHGTKSTHPVALTTTVFPQAPPG